MQSTHQTILYDESCAFCRAAVRFITRRDPNALFRFMPLASDDAAALLRECGVGFSDGSSLILVREGGCHSKSDAALHIAAQLSGPWRYGRVLRVVPRPVRDWVYSLIARHRHRLHR